MERWKKEFESLRNEDPWHPQRLAAFAMCCQILICSQIFSNVSYEKSQEILKFLKSVRRTKTEPFYYRAKANLVTGLSHIKGLDAHAATLKYFDKAISLCDLAGDSEKKRWVFLDGKPVLLEKEFEDIVTIINETTIGFQNKFAFCAWHPSRPGDSVDYSPIAGVACDYCLKLHDEIDGDGMLKCSNCNMAFYCSAECQKKAWIEHNHKKECRAKGVFRQFDVAVVTESVGEIAAGAHVRLVIPGDGPESFYKPDMETGRISKELEKTLTLSSFWIVKEKDGEGIGVVSAAKLKRVRPAVWRAFTEKDLAMIVEQLVEKGEETGESTKDDDDNSAIPQLVSSSVSEADCDSDGEEDLAVEG